MQLRSWASRYGSGLNFRPGSVIAIFSCSMFRVDFRMRRTSWLSWMPRIPWRSWMRGGKSPNTRNNMFSPFCRNSTRGIGLGSMSNLGWICRPSTSAVPVLCGRRAGFDSPSGQIYSYPFGPGDAGQGGEAARRPTIRRVLRRKSRSNIS